jgi:zinc protease
VINFPTCTRRIAFIVATCFALTALAPAPSQAAAKIQHLISPGGIEAWFVQDATVPLVAMEYSFGGGATQDPADKSGVGNMVANLLDEGSEDLDSKTFHERLDRRAIELSFSSSRDTFRGSLRMLRDNRDEAFDLLRMALTSPHFDTADVERIRAVTAEQVRDAAQKWLDKKRSVTGYLIKDAAPKREEPKREEKRS